jgi:hypothetical protein
MSNWAAAQTRLEAYLQTSFSLIFNREERLGGSASQLGFGAKALIES